MPQTSLLPTPSNWQGDSLPESSGYTRSAQKAGRWKQAAFHTTLENLSRKPETSSCSQICSELSPTSLFSSSTTGAASASTRAFKSGSDQLFWQMNKRLKWCSSPTCGRTSASADPKNPTVIFFSGVRLLSCRPETLMTVPTSSRKKNVAVSLPVYTDCFWHPAAGVKRKWRRARKARPVPESHKCNMHRSSVKNYFQGI